MAESIARDRLPVAEEQSGGPLIVTEDVQLLDDLLRLCAAAGAEPEVHHTLPEGRGGWERAPMVLVGDDAAPRCRGVARRQGVMLVGRDQDAPDVWRRGVEIGAEYVLRLPDAESWLVDQIANAAEGVGRPALTVGVIGGRGGAGASTLACALAVAAARSGRRTMLIDGDPLGGGIDVLLGGERAEGMRWPDFAHSKGRVGGGALEESLPALHGYWSAPGCWNRCLPIPRSRTCWCPRRTGCGWTGEAGSNSPGSPSGTPRRCAGWRSGSQRLDGTRTHAVLPPVSVGSTCLSLRVVRPRAFSLAELVAAGTVPPGGGLRCSVLRGAGPQQPMKPNCFSVSANCSSVRGRFPPPPRQRTV
ncbi:septum site-determining protein Ssd [Streptomyces sp. NPDC005571]|uniref:septum site-determining protein Ssd n=1 Tax=Streptomyces sp. NPDC005571 TaxID=3156888 RepID=UPI0033A0678C